MSMLAVLDGDQSRGEIMALSLKDEKHFRERYLQVGIALGVIEMTLPDKPRSSMQKYRLSASGRTVVSARMNKGPNR